MDNVCHTLVGAAIGHTGLKRRTRFAQGALMISANVPDLDVLVFLTEEADRRQPKGAGREGGSS
jgi:inner membrane protein